MCFSAYCFLVIVVINSSLASVYNVAVVEFEINVDYSKPAKDILEENARNYLSLIENITQDQSQGLDLIVFPESTLTPYFNFNDTASQLPNSSNVVLCNSTGDHYDSLLKNISCAAIRHKTTIVINLTEKENCEIAGENECLDYGEFFYNTNVAFGLNGTIIARYRKWNLFGELGKSKPKTLDLDVIEIKNTTFGMMTCFDIQFGTPAFNLTKEKLVQNIIFPLNWISELPFLTALQVQQMWAQEFNVVLLASGASLPQSGAGGSGIFFGSQGSLESNILPVSGTKFMIQSVPTDMQQKVNISSKEDTAEIIDILAAAMDNFFMLIDPSIKDHNSIILNTNQSSINTTVCHGKGGNILCCDFNISISVNSDLSKEHFDSYVYHMVAFNGVRTYSNVYYGGVETCGIIACLNSSLESCGQRFSNYSSITWPLTFNAMSVKGNFTQSNQRIQLPSTLLTSIRPLPIQDYSWEKREVNFSIIRSLALQKPQNRLLTFGIFGRDFERDWDPVRNNTNNIAPKKCFLNVFIMLNFSLLTFLSY